MTGSDEFLSRWSRLKRTSSEHTAPSEQAVSPDAAAQVDADAADKTDDEILEELGLPDPDALDGGDDFSAFMSSAVPTRLRNRALRRLWGTNPVLANLDELLDYGEDYTDAATVVENMQTAYQVGRGWLKDPDTAEKDKANVEQAVAEAEDVVGAPPDTNSDDNAAMVEDSEEAGPGASALTDASETEAAGLEESSDPEDIAANLAVADPAMPVPDALQPRARRMKFRFDS